MSYDSYRVSVKVLENGFEVEVPDMEAIAAKKKEAEKKDPTYPPYIGDCTKCYAAKNVAEVIKLVRGSLEKLPSEDFDAAFEEAAAMDK